MQLEDISLVWRLCNQLGRRMPIITGRTHAVQVIQALTRELRAHNEQEERSRARRRSPVYDRHSRDRRSKSHREEIHELLRNSWHGTKKYVFVKRK